MAGKNNGGDEVAALLFWGGEITKRGDLASVDYSGPPLAMCFLSRASCRLRALTAKVHAALGSNGADQINGGGASRSRLALFGRYPMTVPGDKVVFVSIPLTDDRSYCWFLDEAVPLSKPLHVYAIPSPKRITIIDADDQEEEEEEI